MAETLSAGSVNAMSQVHDQDERLWLGGVFDTATFDGGWGFLA